MYMFKLLLVVLNSRAKVQIFFHIRKRESVCAQFIPYFRQFLHMREGRSLQQGVFRSQKAEVRNQKCPKIASQCGCNNPYAPNGFLKVSATNDFL